MDRLNLKADERTLLGKKVKTLRRNGFLPAHVFGKGLDSEHVSLNTKDFLAIFASTGETGLINLNIGKDNIKPVMVRGVQYDPVSGDPLHIDFYQVNLKEKVTVPVPLVLVGEEPEAVKLGEAIILQTLNEVQVEALPTDLVEKIEVDTSSLKAIDDAITIGDLKYDSEKLTLVAEAEEIVVKLAPAVTAEMEKLMEEQAAEAAAAVVTVEGEAVKGAEGVVPAEGEVPAEGSEKTPVEPQEKKE